jgi:hypothetical protein
MMSALGYRVSHRCAPVSRGVGGGGGGGVRSRPADRVKAASTASFPQFGKYVLDNGMTDLYEVRECSCQS